MLAFLAIIIWHFQHVHLNPEVFPIGRARLTGKISEHKIKERHPLEYERIMSSKRKQTKRSEPERNNRLWPAILIHRKNKSRTRA